MVVGGIVVGAIVVVVVGRTVVVGATVVVGVAVVVVVGVAVVAGPLVVVGLLVGWLVGPLVGWLVVSINLTQYQAGGSIVVVGPTVVVAWLQLDCEQETPLM